MWIARDIVGNLLLFRVKPFRTDTTWWFERPEDINERDYEAMSKLWMSLDSNLFPELKWEDEPVEIEMFPKDKPSDYVLDKVITLADILTAFYVFFAATPDKCPLHDKDALREEWKNLDKTLENAKKGDWK